MKGKPVRKLGLSISSSLLMLAIVFMLQEATSQPSVVREPFTCGETVTNLKELLNLATDNSSMSPDFVALSISTIAFSVILRSNTPEKARISCVDVGDNFSLPLNESTKFL